MLLFCLLVASRHFLLRALVILEHFSLKTISSDHYRLLVASLWTHVKTRLILDLELFLDLYYRLRLARLYHYVLDLEIFFSDGRLIERVKVTVVFIV